MASGTLNSGENIITSSKLNTKVTLKTENTYVPNDIILNFQVNDTNLVANNIKNGVSIFNVTGNYEPPSYNWMGKNVEFIQNLGTTTLNLQDDTDFSSWTFATNTATTIKTGDTIATYTGDLTNYGYFIIWHCRTDIKYTNDQIVYPSIINQYTVIHTQIYNRSSTYANLMAGTYNASTAFNATAAFIDTWNTKKARTLAYTAFYGIYSTATSPTISNNVITIKSPNILIRGNNSYLTSDSYNAIDAANSNFIISGDLYRVDYQQSFYGGLMIDVMNFYRDENSQEE